MFKCLVNVRQNICLSPFAVSNEKPDIVQDGIIGWHHGKDEKGGKSESPHDGGCQRRPEDGFPAQPEGHGRQAADGGDAGEDDGPHAHVAGTHDGHVYLIGMLFAIPVDEIDEDQGIVDHNAGEGQRPMSVMKCEGVITHQQTRSAPPGKQRGW
jgi:hypothetical protein